MHTIATLQIPTTDTKSNKLATDVMNIMIKKLDGQ